MPVSKFFKLLFALATLLCGCSRGYETAGGYAQGGVWSVTYNAEGISVSRGEVQSAIDAILEDIDTTLSGYNRNSLLSRLNAGESVGLNPLFEEIYSLSYDIFLESGGAVDVAAGPIFDLWGFGFSGGSMPDAAAVDSVRARCGMRLLKAPDQIVSLL